MKKFMQMIQNEIRIRSIILFFLGAVLFFLPKQLYSLIVFLIVGYLTIMGLFQLFTAWQEKTNNQSITMPVIYGIGLLLLALIIYLYNIQLASIGAILLGIIMILNGSIDILRYVNDKKMLRQPVWLYLTIGILAVIGGVIVIINPFATLINLLRFVGTAFVIISIGDIYYSRTIQNIK